MTSQMMFLDCPAYLDEEGTVRCGLPAEVTSRFIMRSSDAPIEGAMIRCPSGHWFSAPIEFLTSKEEKHGAGSAGRSSGGGSDGLRGVAGGLAQAPVLSRLLLQAALRSAEADTGEKE